ncbi:MAG: DUF2807 domain-containing protein [Marinilabiliaceae bacterium]|nr:DUF2807 domain-containing protein [Marinilabiliaceae bacterium]
MDLYLTQGKSNSLTIECDRELLNKIIAQTHEGHLFIKSNETIKWQKGKTPKVTVTFSNLKKLMQPEDQKYILITSLHLTPYQLTTIMVPMFIYQLNVNY